MNYSFDITLKNRAIFSHFLDNIPLTLLNKVPEGFNNTIFWNIKHTVITQQLLVYGLSGLPMNVSEEEVKAFRKGTKPEKDATQKDVEICKNQLVSLIKRTEKDWESGIFVDFKEYTVTTKSTLTSAKEAIEFNNFHEGIHLGYVLALKRALGV